ncbi:MAG: AMP-binding protein [Alphaproteobacteria bacterium RIFCSPHIGHO2_12_FULL_63_12]|nr:MAG: AMP-binding protein [Alphaproteobacteria bacterium RIFCSPHIGHO2_12_FULL_63_12]
MTATAQSYVCGVSDTPLIYQTIGRALDEAVRRFGDRPALIVRRQNLRMTYAAFASAVDDFAAGLVALGLQTGDRIGIWSPNNAEWVIAQFATARLGLILVNINPAYRTSELEYVLNKVGARALILARSFKTSDYVGMLGSIGAHKLPQLEQAIVISDAPVEGYRRFADISALATPALRERVREIGDTLSPDDPVNIQFTSGTTGFPKGATLTHSNILNNGRFVGARQRFTEDDRLCIPVPLYHCFGMVMAVLACVTHGAAMVFPDEAFDPASVLDAIEQERCTALYGVPTMFIAELDHPSFKGRDLSSLRTGVMAGAPCPEAVMRRVISDMHMRDVTICYGMTETSPVSFQSLPDDDLEKRVSTVGAIHPYVEVKIIDAEGRITPRGTQGELLTRGYSVMRGYWGDAEKTRESIDEGGWMHTGDLAVMGDDGYCRITGRVKDMIIRGGENVYPREIEEFLYTHPAVMDVQVFGVPDEKYGEEVCAWIRLHDGAAIVDEEIRAFCKSRIAHYKVPRYIRFVGEFPMTVTGKIQKFVMRDAMTKELSAPKASAG